MRRFLARLLRPFAALALIAFVACVSNGLWMVALALLPVVAAFALL